MTTPMSPYMAQREHYPAIVRPSPPRPSRRLPSRSAPPCRRAWRAIHRPAKPEGRLAAAPGGQRAPKQQRLFATDFSPVPGNQSALMKSVIRSSPT